MRERIKTDNVEKGRGIGGIVEDTERGLSNFGKEDTKQSTQRLDCRISKSRGGRKRGRK